MGAECWCPGEPEATSHHRKDGAQVLLLSCAKPPAKAPKGTACYTVVDGTVVEVEP